MLISFTERYFSIGCQSIKPQGSNILKADRQVQTNFLHHLLSCVLGFGPLFMHSQEMETSGARLWREFSGKELGSEPWGPKVNPQNPHLWSQHWKSKDRQIPGAHWYSMDQGVWPPAYTYAIMHTDPLLVWTKCCAFLTLISYLFFGKMKKI